MKSAILRTLSLAALAAVLMVAFGDAHDEFKSFIDVRAAVLVFLAPVFVLVLFQKDQIDFSYLFRRMREAGARKNPELNQELQKNTEGATGRFGVSHVLKMTEKHPDSMIRYAGELVAARFRTEEMETLLAQRIQAEDQKWQTATSALAFLAKMAPYFGMLATVIGMIQLLERLEDFTKISGSMALAMQGTLYGLVSFLLVYSPLQKTFLGWRESMLKRNEMIARWFILVSKRTEGAYIREEIRVIDDLSEDVAHSANPRKPESVV